MGRPFIYRRDNNRPSTELLGYFLCRLLNYVITITEYIVRNVYDCGMMNWKGLGRKWL